MFEEKPKSGGEIIRGVGETSKERQSREQRKAEQQEWEQRQEALNKARAERVQEDQAALDYQRKLLEAMAEQDAQNRGETVPVEQLPTSKAEQKSSPILSAPVKKTGFAGLFQRITKSGRAERAHADSLKKADDDIY